MIVSLELRLSLTCEACDSGVPVNGPVPLVKCARCMEVTALTGEHGWDRLLPKSVFVNAVRSGKPGETTRAETSVAKLTLTQRFPGCPGCGEAHEPRRTKLALMKGRALACKCGVGLEVQPVPAAFLSAHPFTRGFVDAEVFDEGSGVAAPASGGPVVMQCMKCHAALPVDGTKRLVECSYCTARNYLPDDLWLTLHPAPKKESWFILFDGGELLDSLNV